MWQEKNNTVLITKVACTRKLKGRRVVPKKVSPWINTSSHIARGYVWQENNNAVRAINQIHLDSIKKRFWRQFVKQRALSHGWFSKFSNTIGHRSINGLCLTLLLCKCYKLLLNNGRNQTKIFRFNSSLTTSRSNITEKVLQPGETLQGKSSWIVFKVFQIRSAIDRSTDFVWPCCDVSATSEF